ncbi:MAG: SHOCT domain-containing protein [Gaiellales bacterium]
MGLFSRGKDERVDGTAQIVSCNRPAQHAVFSPCTMNIVVSASGVEAVAIERTQLMRASKWPRPGMALPAKVDPGNPSDAEIDFGAIPKSADQARDAAAQLAAAMNQQGAEGAGGVAMGLGPMLAGARVQVTGPGANDPEKLRRAEQMLGIDLDGDGQVGGPPPAATPSEGDDPIAQLERLVKLREAGALTDAEFEAQKQRVLGDS